MIDSSYKHRKNHKRLPWEHHIGCQMCQIACFKSTEKVNLKKNAVVTAVTKVAVVKTIMQPLHKKILNLYFFFFLSTFGKSNLTHLTANVMSSGQHFAILPMFCWEVAWFFLEILCNFFEERMHDCFVVERLRDFWVERFCDVFVWRGCMIFSLTHKGAWLF